MSGLQMAGFKTLLSLSVYVQFVVKRVVSGVIGQCVVGRHGVASLGSAGAGPREALTKKKV